jgi:phosphotransferase system enzyme I (PtsP)
MGVLIVQRMEADVFTENESSFLVTIAAQLAGVINHAAIDGSVRKLLDEGAREAQFLQGIPGASGVVVGTIAIASPGATFESLPDRPVTDSASEAEAFRTAVAKVQEELRSGGAQLTAELPAEERALFDAYVMLAGSDSLVSGTVQRIEAGNWGPGALRDTIAEHAAIFEQMEDPYLRARAEDIRAIGRQILVHLQPDAGAPKAYPDQCVLFGEEISVAEIAAVPTACLAGIVCTRGSTLSHTAILARGLGVPAVMGLGELSLGPLDGREVAVDGYQGRVYIQPSASVRDEYRRLAAEEAALTKGLEGLRDLPAQTPDGARVALYVNGGLLADIPAAFDTGAEGVGLYRTEFAFMARDSFPGEDEQYRTYRKALMLFAPKPVTMRTLDVGGDKPLPYFTIEEANPFLGWRGIRVTLDHPEILLTQLRAMLRANAGLGNLRVLLPMVSKMVEVDKAIELLDHAHRELLEEGRSSSKPLLGVMIETPATLYQIAALVRRVDFFSIGTNDLTQYLLVVDRNNARVASLFDSLHPAVLCAINQVVEESHRWGKSVSVCGEMAGDPAAALLLLGMGVESLSMPGPDLPRVKRVIRTFSQVQARQLVDRTLRLEDASEVRGVLTDALDQAGLGGLVRAGQ